MRKSKLVVLKVSENRLIDCLDCNFLILKQAKKRPNTIPIFGLGKWLLGESRALKVGINAGG
ncbi:hypothetical protein C5Y41_10235 [Rahnella variigena]|nr:hypothetical protein C5Y41_10235 [Rahnella variigena]